MVRRKFLLALPVLVAAPSASADETAGVQHWHAEGTQIYDCSKKNDAVGWILRQPEATLTDADGRIRASHGAGPSWTAADGSRVVGRAITTIPSPRAGAIPWLVLQADAPVGPGTLDGVSYVLRTDTIGGLPPGVGCDVDHEGAVVAVPYEATYSFLKPITPHH